MPLAIIAAILSLLFCASSGRAEVTSVSVTSRSAVASGQSFGNVGPYEKLVGKIEFALDAADGHNKKIVDLDHASRAADGKVHFSADLYVFQPVDPARGNGVLFFEIANRGRLGLLGRFSRAAGPTDPTGRADFGDGYLMREGYTLVWVGWEFDVPAPLLRMDAPAAVFRAGETVEPLSTVLLVNHPSMEAVLSDQIGGPVLYQPADTNNPKNVLTVRDRFWDAPVTIPHDKWRFMTMGGTPPKVHLDTGFEPGRIYEVTYQATGAVVSGAGMAAIRDAASAFVYRTDLPVHGRSAYIFGASQSGRYLREFLYEGFNADEQDRRVFDAVWVHIAGTGFDLVNVRFATPTHGNGFVATHFPFTDSEEQGLNGVRDSLEAAYRPEQRPKIFYTNTDVEYWGQGRAAALIHTSIDGKKDAPIPPNVRIYLLSDTQHGEAAFPPRATNGQQLNNPTPQAAVMRALLRALHHWVADGTNPPDSRYPRLSDHTLVPVAQVRFPKLEGISDPRQITGPALNVKGKNVPLPFLVPQVDADGNDLAGIRVPDITVPLATATGWNFRSPSVGNPGDIYPLLGTYVPFASTQADREARHDPRLSVAERYTSRDDYLKKIRAAADELVRSGFLLSEDMDDVMNRATAHWQYVNRPGSTSSN